VRCSRRHQHHTTRRVAAGPLRSHRRSPRRSSASGTHRAPRSGPTRTGARLSPGCARRRRRRRSGEPASRAIPDNAQRVDSVLGDSGGAPAGWVGRSRGTRTVRGRVVVLGACVADWRSVGATKAPNRYGGEEAVRDVSAFGLALLAAFVVFRLVVGLVVIRRRESRFKRPNR